MTNKIKGVAAAMAAVAALAIGGAAIAGAAGTATPPPSSRPANAVTQSGATAENQEANEGPDQAIGGTALDQASAAALQHTGGGQVTDTEVGDEESYYEVEVSRDDGIQVDVQLDRSFNVVVARSTRSNEEGLGNLEPGTAEQAPVLGGGLFFGRAVSATATAASVSGLREPIETTLQSSKSIAAAAARLPARDIEGSTS